MHAQAVTQLNQHLKSIPHFLAPDQRSLPRLLVPNASRRSSVLLVQSQPSQNRASGFNLNRLKFVLGSPLKIIHSSLFVYRSLGMTVPRAQSWVCMVEIFVQA